MRRLELIFGSARDLAEVYFGVDFPDDVVADQPLWDTISKAANGLTPLPASNSSAAKQMRVATFLAILSRELSRLFFQPTYILDGGGAELSEFLGELANRDAERETYLRSVLLAASPPPTQAEALEKRIHITVEKLLGIAGALFAESEQAKFKAALEILCKTAGDNWLAIQKVEYRIEPVFDCRNFEDWRSLSYKSPELSGITSPNSKAQSNASASLSTSGNSKKNKPIAPTSAGPNPELSRAVVWPSFFVTSSDVDDETPLTQGYVLCESQLQTAREEEKAILNAAPRRAVRQSVRRKRTMSSPSGGGGVASNRAVINPTTASAPGSFLPKGGGGPKGG